MGGPKYRWRTRTRRHLPWWLIDLGVATKGKKDCGEHEWYNHDGIEYLCYHCAVGTRPAADDDPRAPAR